MDKCRLWTYINIYIYILRVVKNYIYLFFMVRTILLLLLTVLDMILNKCLKNYKNVLSDLFKISYNKVTIPLTCVLSQQLSLRITSNNLLKRTILKLLQIFYLQLLQNHQSDKMTSNNRGLYQTSVKNYCRKKYSRKYFNRFQKKNFNIVAILM